MDELPRIRSTPYLTQDIDYERELPSILAESAQEILKSLVKIKDIR